MEIIEQVLKSKTGNMEQCEDNIIVNSKFAAVIDGATSETEYKIGGVAPGKFASQKIAEAIEKLDPESNLQDCIEFITSFLNSTYKTLDIYKQLLNNPINRPTASLALYSKFHNQVWLIGDCQCMIADKIFTNKKEIDRIISRARSIFLESEKLKGISREELLKTKKGREYIFPLLKRQKLMQNNQNSQYAYGVLDGFDYILDDAKSINVNGEEIILASDGYPKLFNTLEKSEQYLKNLIDKDPLLFKQFKSTKGVYKGNNSFDDRCYLRFKV